MQQIISDYKNKKNGHNNNNNNNNNNNEWSPSDRRFK